MSYLVCNKCGGYYELQPGETPEDYSNECECGGKLEYKKRLRSNDRSNPNNHHPKFPLKTRFLLFLPALVIVTILREFIYLIWVIPGNFLLALEYFL